MSSETPPPDGAGASALPCPPGFLLELAVVRPDELILAHLAECRSCAEEYERLLPRAGVERPVLVRAQSA